MMFEQIWLLFLWLWCVCVLLIGCLVLSALSCFLLFLRASVPLKYLVFCCIRRFAICDRRQPRPDNRQWPKFCGCVRLICSLGWFLAKGFFGGLFHRQGNESRTELCESAVRLGFP